ncbi:heterokaryon incompatibility protein-domain-containing protein [Nemania sp. FL0916]|nr:heterokaryon incompatibility protein-domain-containing protein [Nemania sp. FL0916]
MSGYWTMWPSRTKLKHSLKCLRASIHGRHPFKQYSYQPLVPCEIRIIEVHPGESDEPIHITLHHERFDAGDDVENRIIPSYEALSYVWGSRETQERVFIDGYTIEITRNLAIALKHLRFRDKPRFMWIDALSINQSDEAEKGPCVAMMGEIYRHAASVVVWLGEDENDCVRAMKLLSWLDDQIEVDDQFDVISPAAQRSTHRSVDMTLLVDTTKPLPFDEAEMRSIYSLFCCSWFDRLWIRQEIYLASPTAAVIICGDYSMPWLAFRKALAFCCLKPVGEFKFRYELAARRNHVWGVVFRSYASTMPLLREAYGDAKCDDPRDRIYAILRMDRNAQLLDIVPDYVNVKSHLVLYEDVTRRVIDCFKCLDVLSECELADMPSADDATGRRTPSWVPDWSTGSPYITSLRIFANYASGCFTGPNFPIVDNRLRVVAVPIDEILRTQSHPVTVKSSAKQILSTLPALASSMQLYEDYPSGGTYLEAYASTLTTGLFSDAVADALHSLPDRDSTAQFIKKLIATPSIFAGGDESPVKLSADERRVANPMYSRLVGRSFVTTRTGYIGLACKSAAPGDEVCVILGCHVPMVLRRIDDDDDRRTVVGPCYIEGFSDGEAVLGSFPADVRRKVGQLSQTFTSVNGDSQIIDPRLKSWDEFDTSVISERVRQAFRYFFEVDVNDLKRHGIHNARYLDLV